MSSPRRPQRATDRGMLSTELAVLMPTMFLLALLAVYIVHVERHGSRAQQAADAAARAASLVVDEADARSAAQSAAEAVCNGSVTIAHWDFVPPDIATFTPGSISVGVTCRERFDAFGRLVNNQIRTEHAVSISAVEYWRSDS